MGPLLAIPLVQWLLGTLGAAGATAGSMVAYDRLVGDPKEKRRFEQERTLRDDERKAQQELLRYLAQSNAADERKALRGKAEDRRFQREENMLSRLQQDQQLGMAQLAAMMMRRDPQVAASHQMEFAARTEQRAMRDLDKLATLGGPVDTAADLNDDIMRYFGGLR